MWGTLPRFHKIPLSLDTYFSLYKNPDNWKISLILKSKYIDSKYDDKQIINRIQKNDNQIGKLIITSNFQHIKSTEPFKLPILIVKSK